jgi:clan AA aspartic protease
MTPQVDVVVGGTRGNVQVKACLDTGFDGDICVPTEVAVTLGLELIGCEPIELADGSRKPELVFKGYAILLGKKRVVEILLTDSEESLVGTGLLAECRLSIDFSTGKVRLAHKPPRKR